VGGTQGYAEEARRKGWCSSAVADALVDRLKDHFRADLAGRLLYPQERAQHKKLVAKSGSDVCDVYGPEHLLRMFTTLPVRTCMTSSFPGLWLACLAFSPDRSLLLLIGTCSACSPRCGQFEDSHDHALCSFLSPLSVSSCVLAAAHHDAAHNVLLRDWLVLLSSFPFCDLFLL
jgi:hypothetical protein